MKAAEAAAVDGGVLQLEDGVGGVGGAVLVAVDLDGAVVGAVEIVQRVVEQGELGAGVGVVDLQLAVVGELAWGEVLDDVGGGVGDQQLTVDVEAAEAAAVDGGVLQLEDGVGCVGGAVLVAVDLDGAVVGAVEIVQRDVEQGELGAGVGVVDLQPAVVGELAWGEVLDDVGGGVGDQQLTVDVEAAEAAAVDGGVLQLEDGVGCVGGAVLVAVDLDGAVVGAVEIVQRVVEQGELGAGVGVVDLQPAVVGELAWGEVLDDVGRRPSVTSS